MKSNEESLFDFKDTSKRENKYIVEILEENREGQKFYLKK